MCLVRRTAAGSALTARERGRHPGRGRRAGPADRPAPSNAKYIVYNGAGGYVLPDGTTGTTAAGDGSGGFRLPHGAYVAPDGTGGVTLPNGTRCTSDGARGYLCP
jgi:hypothetical protein